MAMSMGGRTTTGGSQNGQGPSSSDGYETLQLQIRSVRDTVLLYWIPGTEEQHKYITCEILNDDMKLIESKYWSHLVNANESPTFRKEHICFYELWETDTLMQVKTNCSSDFIMGFILVNEAGCVDESFWGNADINVPVCIISRTNCKDLLNHFFASGQSKNTTHQKDVFVKFSAMYGVFSYKCGLKNGDVEFSYPCIECSMVSKQIRCFKLIPDSLSSDEQCFIIKEFSCQQDQHYIENILAKKKEVTGIVLFNVPDGQLEMVKSWKSETGIYILSRGNGQQLMTMLESLNAPWQVMSGSGSTSSMPGLLVRVLPIHGELKYTKKNKDYDTQRIPFTAYADWESSEIRCPPFIQPLRCVDAKDANDVHPQPPFLAYYVLNHGESSANLYKAMYNNRKMEASSIIVINCMDTVTLEKSFFSSKNVDKAFPLPLIVISCRHHKFISDLKNHKEKLEIKLLLQEGKLLFNGKLKDSPHFSVFTRKTAVPTDPKHVVFPSDAALPLFYFRVCHCNDSVSYSSLMSFYEQEVKSGALIGLIIACKGHETEKSKVVKLPPHFLESEADLNLPRIPVIGIFLQDAERLFNHKKISSGGSQVKEGRVMRFRRWAGQAVGSVISAVSSTIAPPATFAVCELFNDIDWMSSTPQVVYFKFSAKLKDWKQMSDQKDAVLFLKENLKSTGVKHLPLHILAAWSMRIDPNIEADYLLSIYEAVKGEKSKVLEQNMLAYKELVVQSSEFSYLLQAAEHFVQVPTAPEVLAFWITFYLYVLEILGEKTSSVQWSLLYEQGCKPLSEENYAILQKWIRLGQHVGIKHQYQFNHENLSLLVLKSFISSFTSLEVIVSQFRVLVLDSPGRIHKFLKTLRGKGWLSKLSYAKKMINKGVHFLHDSVMLQYCTHDKPEDGILNELEQWWRELVKKINFRLLEDSIAIYRTIHSVLMNSQCACSAKMMDVVKQEILHTMQSGSFTKTVTLENFCRLYREISWISQQVVVSVLKHHPLMSLPSEKDPAFKLMTLALERFPNEEMSDVVSSVILKATAFQQDGRAFDVLLHMDLPRLFPVSVPNMRNVYQKFTTQMKREIENKRLKDMVQDCFLKWLDEEKRLQGPLQHLVLDAMLPSLQVSTVDLKIIETEPEKSKSFQCFQAVMHKMVIFYEIPESYQSIKPELPYNMLWRIIESSISGINPATGIIDCCQKFKHMIKAASPLYLKANEVKALTASLWKEYPPAGDYLAWIESILRNLRKLERKVNDSDWNADFIRSYQSSESAIADVAQCLHTQVTFIPSQTLCKRMNVAQMQIVEIVVKKSDSNTWISLITILDKLGISLQVRDVSHGTVDPEALSKVDGTSAENAGSVDGRLSIINKKATMKSLMAALETMLKTFQPLKESMEALVYFSSKKGRLFEKHLGSGLKAKESKSLQDFGRCLVNTVDFLLKMTAREVGYKELKDLEFFRLTEAQKLTEIDLLRNFRSFRQMGDSGDDFLSSFKDMTDLLSLMDRIPYIQSVCRMCGLERCLKNADFEYLVEIQDTYGTPEAKDAMNSRLASDAMKQIRPILPLDGQQLEIFVHLTENEDFYKFIKDIELQGKNRFRSLYTLISSMLQHEEYNDEVLNQLPIARDFILPFLDEEQDFKGLLKGVVEVCKKARNEFWQLDVMKRNISLVHQWFSKAEDHSLESVVQDMELVVKGGEFCVSSQLGLCCEGLSTHQVSSSHGQGNDGTRCIISEEWIDDFNRRLGLLEKKQVTGASTDEDPNDTLLMNIEIFQLSYKRTKKMSLLWSEMRSLGFPYYDDGVTVPCSSSGSDLDSIESDMKEKLLVWKTMLNTLRSIFKELLLYPIPKVGRICEAVKSRNPDMILKEIPNIFISHQKNAVQLKQHIQMSLNVPVMVTAEEMAISTQYMEPSDCGPFKIVGNFLHNVAGGEFLQDQKYSVQKVVHILPGRSQKETLNLLFSVYGRIPNSFEVYHCRRNTTDKDLQFIFDRAKAFRMTLCIVNVNMLSLRLQEILLKLHKQSVSEECGIHYVASGASIVQDLPQVEVRKEPPADDPAMKEQWLDLCSAYKEMFAINKTLNRLELVYGHPGDGKSHYICKKMTGPNPSAVVTFDESFSVEEAIENLQSISLKANAVVYFNFTLLPANKKSSSQDKKTYEALVTKIQWFLFDLLFLGYVEHIDSGLSFGFLRESQWTIYVEVPNQEFDQEGEGTGNVSTIRGDPDRSLQEFLEAFPVLDLLGKRHYISPEKKLDIDDDAQLVCKYLKAYSAKDDRRRGIDRKFYGHAQEKVSFARMSDVSVRECHRLLSRYIPSNARVNKLYQMLFVKYMARRCRFLEKCPSYNYNSYEMDEKGKPRPYTIGKCGEEVTIDTSTLGSSLFETMLQEVNDFCSPRRRSNWEGDARQQLVYVLDGIEEDGEEGGSFEVIALKPDDIAEEEKERFQKIQISLHERDELETRDVLDRYIASAFGLKLSKGRLMEIDKKNYVLTLDFALKMLEINERYWARIPVIIEGETGVGKTFLVEMMADLWNGSLMHRWNRTLTRLWTLLHKLSRAMVSDIGNEEDRDEVKEELLVSTLSVLDTSCDKLERNVEDEVDESFIEMIPFGGATQKAIELIMQYAERHYLSTHWNMLMKELENIFVKQPLIHMLKVPCSMFEEKVVQVSRMKWISLDTELRHKVEPESAARNIYTLLFLAEVDVFHRISIHGSLTTEDLRKFFTPIVAQANKIENKWKDESTRPNIVVFLDEINTASSPGLMKEILVDKSLHGQKLPRSVFVIGACNPHRGHSVVMHEKIEVGKKWDWVKGSYYVHRMHQSVRYLLWDYGALDDRQEENYIEAKMAMVMGDDDQEDSESDLKDTLSDKIAESQNLMRMYAAEHYIKSKQFSAEEADELSRSCVSQRDIQRVFTFYLWLLKTYEKFQAKGVDHPATNETLEQWQARAVMVSLGLTYYFRLSTEYREKYMKKMNFNIGRSNALKFSDALKHEMDFYCSIVHLPPGIAKTQALKENLFCVIACCCTKMPLIIVGEPGSSKTLSFNIAASNFKGADSKEELLKDTDLFPCFDPHYYQCSRTTTSKEVEVVFQRALRRQEAVSKHQYDNYQNTVFMDEAGLPEESLESLKVIHKYLDNPQVAFVGITNHILDAAKTNRTVTLFRPRADKDVVELAHGCFGITEQTEEPIKAVFRRLCTCYSDLMSRDDSIKRFFGLRDFIHFMNYLRRQTDRNVRLLEREDFLASQVCRSVERNFNGYENMGIVCSVFCPKEERMFRNTKWRNIIDVLEESLEDKPRPIFIDDQEDFEEVRYKLIIDPTEDDSSRRMMMMFGILKHDQATTVVGSDFSDDGYLQNINAVSKVTHAASSGSTVLMMQTDEIHESFYDLFNQHFRKIKVGTQKGEKKTHFFANVAIGSHSKPCRVNHNFQCLVVIKESELALTPAPFLNRFEKYRLSTACFLEASLNKLSLAPLLREAVEEAKNMTWLDKDCSGSRRSQMKPFVNQLGEASFFGLNDEDTINSLFVTILPKTDIVPSKLEPLSEEWLDQPIGDIIVSILQLVLGGLENLGFSLPMTTQFSMQLAVTLTDMMAGQKAVIFDDFDSNRLLFDAVSEAWAVLISEDGEVGSKKPSVRFLKTFVMSLIHVWVVRKLLQLLTQEAFILHKRTFKGKYSWCLKEYLSQQKEFDVVAASLEEDYHGSPGDGITKLVCFTRSFQAFAKLTSQADDRLSADDDELPVQLCMLSAISSQQEFSDDLQSFTGSATKTVLIILANMFEASKKLINYVRLRIDEIEEGHQVKCPKKFVVLLYFPTSVSQVYPALFLYGWDFQFLDSLDLKESTEYTSQVKHWCSFAYLQPISEELFQSQRSFRLSESCHKILGECGSVLSARVTLRFDDGRSISNREKQKLFKKLLSSPLGETLVCKYLDYWSASPKKVARILHGIAVFSNQLKSLHSITDLFQVYFESTFYNFMAYMIHHINEELDLSTYCEETSDMFLELVEMVEQPKSLASIRGYSNTWGVKKASQTVRHDSDKMRETYTFPAFHKMCMLMENYLEPHFSGGGDDCTQIAVKLMEQQSRHRDTEFSILLHHIDKSDNLLRRYERDFSQRLHLSDQDLQFVHQYMASGRSSAGTNVTKLVELHFVAYATPIDFSHLRKLMMPLLTIHRTSTQESPSEFIMELVLKSTGGDETGSRCLADFIVDSLESHLVSCNGERRLLQSWQDAFQDVCKERELEVALYSSGQFYTPGFRSRFLCVKTVFILMQSDSAPTEEYCKCIWTCHKLLQKEQKQCMENGVQFGLKSILDIVLNKPETAYFRQPIDSILPKFLPELFHHVFHPLLPVYQETDVSDFLEFVLRLPFSKTQDDCTVSLVTLNQVMMRILTCGKNDEEKDEDNYGVFKSRKTSVKQVLASDDAVGEYLPPYYEGSQSTLLAHLYFFSVMNLILGQMADSQKKISECIRAINSLKDTTDHLLAIEKEVCILLLISQVASELSDDKKAAKIENEKKDKIFTKALCRVGNCKGHCEVFEVLLGSLTDKQRAQKILKKVTVWLKVEHKDGKSAGVCSVIKRELVPFSWTKSDILEVLHVHRARNACAKLLCRLIDPDCHEKLMMELKLLPIIVEFCTCLKSLLNFKVDERTARNLDIKTAIEHACDEVTSLDKKEKIRQLLRDFKTYFNDWRKKTPALEEIGGDTPLANILMIAGTTEGQCQTVAVLNSFLNPHNRVVQLAYDCAKDNLMTWFPKPQEIEVHEVENLKHLFPKLPTEAHLLDCMRKCLPVVGRDTDKECVERMCAAVMKEFLVGTPTILEPTAEMIQDLFSLSMKSLSVDRQSNFVFNNELADVHEQLKGCFQNTKESFASHKKDIFAHFHNADHALLECIVRGLLLVAHHLTQEKKPEDWSERPLYQFVTHVQESLPNMMNMTRSTDLRILENLKVRFLEDVLGLFVEWMETGFSDFHSLPLGTKKDPESSQAVYEFLEKKANEFDQKDNLCKLEDVILPDAMGLTVGDFEMLVFEKPLREYVISVHLLKSTSPLLKLIPESIQLKHYVHFMIQLRRVIADHQILSMSESTTDIDESSTDDEAERDPLNLTEIFSRESTLEVVKESEAKEDSDMSDMSDEENTSVTNSVDENSVITSEYTSAKEEEDQSQDIQEDNDSDNHDDYEDLEDADEMDRSRRDMNDSVAVMMDVYGRDDDSDEESGNYDDEQALFHRVPYADRYSRDTFESRNNIVLEDIEELSNGNTGATYESGIVHDPLQGSDSSTHAGSAFQELSQPVKQQITTPSQSWSQMHEDPPHSYGGPPYPHGVLPHPHGGPYQLHDGQYQPHASSQPPYIGPQQPHGGLIYPHGVPPQPHGNPAQPHGDPPPLDESVPQSHGGPPGGQPHPHGGPPQPHEDPLLPHGDPHGGPPQSHGGKPQPIGDPPQPHGGPLQPHGGPSQPHGGPPQPHRGPPQPHVSPPQPHGGPPQPPGSPRQPHRGPPQPHGSPPQPHGGPPQPHGGPSRPHRGPPQPHGSPPQAPRSLPQQYGGPPQPHGGQPQLHEGPSRPHGGQLQPHGGLPQSHGGQQQQYGSQPQQYGGPPQQYGNLSQQPYNSERYHPYSSGYPMQQSYQALPQGYGMPYGYHVGPPISGYPHSSEAPYMSHQYYPQSMRPEDSYGGYPPQPSSASLLSAESQGSHHSQGGASEKALCMTTEEIICWLEDIGLGEYKEFFESHDIDGSLLGDLNADDLKSKGMDNSFDCKKLLSKFRKI